MMNIEQGMSKEEVFGIGGHTVHVDTQKTAKPYEKFTYLAIKGPGPFSSIGVFSLFAFALIWCSQEYSFLFHYDLYVEVITS